MKRSTWLAAGLLALLAGCSSTETTPPPVDTVSASPTAAASPTPLVFPSTSTLANRIVQRDAAVFGELKISLAYPAETLKRIYAADPGPEYHSIVACASQAVTPRADLAKTAYFQQEYEASPTDGIMQIVWVLPAPNADKAAAKVKQLEVGCRTYREDISKSTRLTVHSVRLPEGAKDATVRCWMHEPKGKATTYSCYVDLTLGPVYVRLATWAASQQRAEDLLPGITEVALGNLRDVRP